MKKTVVFTFALLAIGIGVTQVFLQRGDGQEHSHTPQSQIIESPIVQIPAADLPIPDAEIAPPPKTERLAAPATETELNGDSFYFLLHPERKNQ
jgi:hypothetical protein